MHSVTIPYFVYLLAFASLTGCVTTPDGGRALSPAGQIVLQEGISIAARRFVLTSPQGVERAAKIREYAGRLYGVTSFTTITDLRASLDAEIDKANLPPLERADWHSFLNMVEAVVREKVGKDELDADAVVKLNDVLAMVVASLPAPPA